MIPHTIALLCHVYTTDCPSKVYLSLTKSSPTELINPSTMPSLNPAHPLETAASHEVILEVRGVIVIVESCPS